MIRINDLIISNTRINDIKPYMIWSLEKCIYLYDNYTLYNKHISVTYVIFLIVSVLKQKYVSHICNRSYIILITGLSIGTLKICQDIAAMLLK